MQRRASLSIPPEHQTAAIRALLQQETFFRALVRRLVDDPAVRQALPAGVGEPELQGLVTSVIRELRAGTPIEQIVRITRTGGEPLAPVLVAALLVVVIIAVAAAVVVVLWVSVAAWITEPRDIDTALTKSLVRLSELLAQLPPVREN